MGKIQIELDERELRVLSELCALGLTVLGQAMPDSRDARVDAWHKLLVELIRAGRSVPELAKDLEYNPDCGYWFFKRPYVEGAFYSDVLDEYRDAVFWEELVTRSAGQVLVEQLGAEKVETLSPEERSRCTAALEQALWNEVTNHGIDRLVFLMPESES
ncbi:MAG: hypothetical protein ACI4PZ_02940 [Akkermansia sp.]